MEISGLKNDGKKIEAGSQPLFVDDDLGSNFIQASRSQPSVESTVNNLEALKQKSKEVNKITILYNILSYLLYHHKLTINR